MGLLSHILTRPKTQTEPLVVRRIGLADDRACTRPVRRLMHNAATGGIRLEHLFGAQRPDGKVIAGLLAVERPGRTATVFVAPPRHDDESAALAQLAHRCVSMLPRQSIAVVQASLQSHETAEAEALLAGGFWKLGDLGYMQYNVPRRPLETPRPADVVLRPWRDELRPAFLDALRASYAQSRDCPALHALREPCDVLAGHKASGLFDAGLWFLVEVRDKPAGVMLLNRVPQLGCMDLVYLGLHPDHRRCGLGSWLVHHALGCAAQREVGRLTLAVDLLNEPAVGLYRSMNFVQTSCRTILMRSLSDQEPQTPG